MKVILEPSGEFTELNGTPCRIWKGKTGKGTPVECFIPLLRSPSDADQSELEEELTEVPPRNVTHPPLSMRHVL